MINPHPPINLHSGVVPCGRDFARSGAGSFIEVRGDVVIDGAGEDDQNFAWEEMAGAWTIRALALIVHRRSRSGGGGTDIRDGFDESGSLGICAADVAP